MSQLPDRLSQYRDRIQGTLFPQLEEELDVRHEAVYEAQVPQKGESDFNAFLIISMTCEIEVLVWSPNEISQVIDNQKGEESTSPFCGTWDEAA